MSTETDAADLSIPPAAVEAYFVCGCSESGVRAGYRPEALAVVVAAELRQMADKVARYNRNRDLRGVGLGAAVGALRAHADQLDTPRP